MIIKTRDFELNTRKLFVKCDCGNTPEFLVTYDQFESKITNCGCKTSYNENLNYHITRFKNITDLELLTIIYIGTYPGSELGIFRCVCSNYFVSNLRHVKEKRSTSCGCRDYERRCSRDGFSADPEYKVAYKAWISLNYRCNNNNTESKDYYNYQIRQITVCDRWKLENPNGFNNFIKDVGNVPSDMSEPSIERLNVNGNYEPSNCIWIERYEQNRNKRTNVLTREDIPVIKDLKFNKNLSCKDISKLYNCSISTIEKTISGQYWNDL
jgi:hypothetical protein